MCSDLRLQQFSDHPLDDPTQEAGIVQRDLLHHLVVHLAIVVGHLFLLES